MRKGTIYQIEFKGDLTATDQKVRGSPDEARGVRAQEDSTPCGRARRGSQRWAFFVENVSVSSTKRRSLPQQQSQPLISEKVDVVRIVTVCDGSE